MGLLDATLPNDLDLLKYHAQYLRETREKCNELEGLLTGTIRFVAQKITALSFVIDQYDVFILADATAGEMTGLLPDPTKLLVGVEYKIKKIDATENNVVLEAYGTTKIDGADTLRLTLPNEVITFVTDGTDLWTT